MAALFVSPDRRWFVRDLARHIGVPPSSLQRELASLTHCALLVREADGKRVYYRANIANPILPELQSLFTKTVGLADRIKVVLEPYWNDIEIAFIFGSVARGERKADSDVDLLVIGSVGLSDLALPLREVEKKLNASINVVHFTASEFREKRSSNHHFLQTILPDQKIFLKGSDNELANIGDKSAA